MRSLVRSYRDRTRRPAHCTDRSRTQIVATSAQPPDQGNEIPWASIGPYIANFISVEAQLVIELDGSQHAEDANQKLDQRRTEYLESLGYDVLRFWNEEVSENIDGVLDRIAEFFKVPHPHGKKCRATSPVGRAITGPGHSAQVSWKVINSRPRQMKRRSSREQSTSFESVQRERPSRCCASKTERGWHHFFPG